jgi:D-alanyl-D-alanine carboxypeptidase
LRTRAWPRSPWRAAGCVRATRTGARPPSVEGGRRSRPGRVVSSRSQPRCEWPRLRLAERGRLALDEPLTGPPYTPRQLLQHRAGIGDYGQLPDYQAAVARGDAPWTDDQLFARVSPARLAFPPGAGWAYSNVGYLLVRRAIERAYGAGLRRVLGDLVLTPLGLSSSRLAETPDDMRATVSRAGTATIRDGPSTASWRAPSSRRRWLSTRLLHGDLLASTARSALLDRHPIGGPIAGRPWVTTGYGLGLMMGTMRRPGMPRPLHVVGHSAGGPGSVGAVYHLPGSERRRTAACFTAGQDEGVPEDEVLRQLAGA